MRRVLFWILGLPAALLIIALSVANRGPVAFSLDPVSSAEPFFSITLPLFVLLFAAGFIGLLVGWTVSLSTQMHWRNEARRHQRHAEELTKAAAKSEKLAETTHLIKAA